MNKVRTMVIDGVEIQTSLTAVELAGLQQENEQLKKDIKYTIPIVEHNRIVSEKNKEIYQLKDNWNKLKEYLTNLISTDKTILTKYIKRD